METQEYTTSTVRSWVLVLLLLMSIGALVLILTRGASAREIQQEQSELYGGISISGGVEAAH